MTPDDIPRYPTTVTFTVDVGQVWVDADGTSWYVTSVGAHSVMLERTVVEKRKIRDLVLGSRQMNEEHPLHPGRRADA